MRRTPKKKTGKKKTATKAAPSKKAAASSEFDNWAANQKRKTGCSCCSHDPAKATIDALLEAAIRNRAYKFAIHDLLAVVNKKHPDADIGQRGLERHLRICVRSLNNRARGRRHG